MNKNQSTTMVAISLIIILVSIATGLSSSKKLKAEILVLRGQIARMEAYLPNSDPSIKSSSSSREIETHDVDILKAMIAEKETEIIVLKYESEMSQKEDRSPRESWEERMARMKEEQPEDYAEIIQRREKRQIETRYNLAKQTATFMDLDTSNMTEEELANHNLLVEKMATIWELSEQFQDPEVAPDHEAMSELYQMTKEVRPLIKDERTVMLKQLGTDLGYEGQDAEDFAAYIEDVIGATNLKLPRGWRGVRKGDGK